MARPIIGVVGEVRLEGVAPGLLRLDVREITAGADRPTTDPLPPVDVAGAPYQFRNRRVLLGVETEELEAEEVAIGNHPLVLGLQRRVIRRRVVDHGLVKGPPRPVAGKIVFVVETEPRPVGVTKLGGQLEIEDIGFINCVQWTERLVGLRVAPVVAGEEPQRVLDDRTADREGDFLVVNRNRHQFIVGVGPQPPRVEAGGGVVARVAHLPVVAGTAVPLVAARFGHHVDRGAREGAVLGLRTKRQDLDLLHRVIVHLHQRAPRRAARVGGVDAVDQEDVLVGRAAIGGRARQPRPVSAHRRHPRRRQGQVVEGLPRRRDCVDHFRAEGGVDG